MGKPVVICYRNEPKNRHTTSPLEIKHLKNRILQRDTVKVFYNVKSGTCLSKVFRICWSSSLHCCSSSSNSSAITFFRRNIVLPILKNAFTILSKGYITQRSCKLLWRALKKKDLMKVTRETYKTVYYGSKRQKIS